jgi:hypothetical protein
MQLTTLSYYGTKHSVVRNARWTAALTKAMITHVARPFTPTSAPKKRETRRLSPAHAHALTVTAAYTL